MSTFTPPIANAVTPRFYPHSTPLQRALYKFMRPLDCGVNVYVWSDGTVTTDFPVPIAGGTSTVLIPAPWNPAAAPIVGAREGSDGGPYGQPPPYSTVVDWDRTVTTYSLNPWPKYTFRGGHGPYVGISANLVSILTAAGYAAYLS